MLTVFLAVDAPVAEPEIVAPVIVILLAAPVVALTVSFTLNFNVGVASIV